MEALRTHAPTVLGGRQVTECIDYLQGLTLPKSNVLEFRMGDSGRVLVRPSGTEPKIKYYLMATAPTRTQAEAQLQGLEKDMAGS